MENNWGTFDETPSDTQAEEVTEASVPAVKELESLIPFGNSHYVKEADQKDSDEVRQDVYIPQENNANYFGQSNEFWLNILMRDNLDINIHFEFDYNENLVENELMPNQAKFNLEDKILKKGSSKAKQVKGRPGYGEGKEHQKLANDPHFNSPAEECYVFKQLRNPNKKNLCLLGQYFNKDFSQYFSKDNQEIRKFSRNENRSKKIGYWFFEDLLRNENTKQIVFPWIKNKIQEINLNDN